jgi:hypothetical protein
MEDEGHYVFESKTSKTKLAVWFDTPPNDSFIRRCLLITISDEEQMDEETTDEVSKSVDDSTLAMEGEETLENINQNTNQSPKPKKQRDNKTGKPESAAGTNLNEHPRFLLKSRESLDSDRLSLSTVKNLFQDRLSRLNAEHEFRCNFDIRFLEISFDFILAISDHGTDEENARQKLDGKMALNEATELFRLNERPGLKEFYVMEVAHRSTQASGKAARQQIGSVMLDRIVWFCPDAYKTRIRLFWEPIVTNGLKDIQNQAWAVDVSLDPGIDLSGDGVNLFR